MTENPLKSTEKSSGSGSTNPGPETALSRTEDPARAIVDGRRPERKLTAEQFDQLFPYRCPLCNQPIMFDIGVKAHLSVDHSWFERIARWADQHPVKLWAIFWLVLAPMAIVTVVMFP